MDYPDVPTSEEVALSYPEVGRCEGCLRLFPSEELTLMPVDEPEDTWSYCEECLLHA